MKIQNIYKIMDLCSSKRTALTTVTGDKKYLNPLEPYILNDNDIILVGGKHQVIFRIDCTEIQASVDVSSKSENLLVPETQTQNCKVEEDSDEQVELPETQISYESYPDSLSQKHAIDFENSPPKRKPKVVKFETETQEYIINEYDIKQNIKEEEPLDCTENYPFQVETQAIKTFLPMTRLRQKKQNQLKPKTRPLKALDETQKPDWCAMATQPVLEEKLFNIKDEESANPILLSSSETSENSENEEEEEDQEEQVDFKPLLQSTQATNAPVESQPFDLNLTPDFLLQSQTFDSAALERINASQDDPSILTFHDDDDDDNDFAVTKVRGAKCVKESEDVKPPPPKKKKYKLMKFGDDY
jgi:hypothetical protein